MRPPFPGVGDSNSRASPSGPNSYDPNPARANASLTPASRFGLTQPSEPTPPNGPQPTRVQHGQIPLLCSAPPLARTSSHLCITGVHVLIPIFFIYFQPLRYCGNFSSPSEKIKKKKKRRNSSTPLSLPRRPPISHDHWLATTRPTTAQPFVVLLLPVEHRTCNTVFHTGRS